MTVSGSDESAGAPQPIGADRILVVDDEPGIREGCRRILSREGCQVEVAATGEEGWEKMQSQPFDLILLDVMMPDVGGIELLKRLVARDPDAVCIIITGYATIELAVQAMREGAYHFIAKPFEADLLRMTVRQGLERRHLRLETHRLAQLQAEKEALERRNVELEREALRQRAEQMAELARLKSAFALTVAHELRAPTAAIQSYLHLMLGGYIPPEEQRAYLLRMDERINAQLALISDLLELARLQNPDLRIVREPVDPAASLREACDAVCGQAEEKGLQLAVSIPPRAPAILADPDHLRSLWCNLLSNAVKYTPEGGAVRVQMIVSDDQIVVQVQDTGIGIAPDELPHLFREFYRTKAARKHTEMGTGLGLSIAKRIVETYGGQIEVASAPGAGSTFTVRLPLDNTPAEPAPA